MKIGSPPSMTVWPRVSVEEAEEEEEEEEKEGDNDLVAKEEAGESWAEEMDEMT